MYQSWEIIRWKGQIIQHQGFKWEQSFNGGLPESVSASGGEAPFSASCTASFADGVIPAFPTPFGFQGPKRGDPVTVEVYTSYPDGWKNTFNLLIDSINYKKDGVELKFISRIDPFTTQVSFDPLISIMPPLYRFQDEDYLNAGYTRNPTATVNWYVSHCFRQAGFHATPPPLGYPLVDITFQGAVWINQWDSLHPTSYPEYMPDDDEVYDSPLSHPPGEMGIVSPENDRTSNIGVDLGTERGIFYMTSGLAEAYAHVYSSSKYFNLIWMMPPAKNHVQGSKRTMYIEVRNKFSGAGKAILWMSISADGEITFNQDKIGGGTEQIGKTTLPTSNMERVFVVQIDRDARKLTIYSRGGFRYTCDMKREFDLPRYVSVNIPSGSKGQGLGIAGVSLAEAGEPRWVNGVIDRAYFTPTARIYPSEFTGYRDHMAGILNKPARELLDEIAQATVCSWWVDGNGNAWWKPIQTLVGADVKHTVSALRDINDYNIVDDLANARQEVEVKYGEWGHCIVKRHTCDAYKGGGALEWGEQKTDFISPKDNEDWFQLDDTVLSGFRNQGEFYSGNGSFYGCIPKNSQGNKDDWIDLELDFSMKKVNERTWVIKQTANNSMRLCSPEHAKVSSYFQALDLPVIRHRGYQEVVSHTTSAIGGMPGAGTLAIDGVKYIEGRDLAVKISRYLAEQVFKPDPVINNLTTIYNPRIEVGDAIRVNGVLRDGSNNLFSAILKCLVVGVAHDPDNSTSTLSIRLINKEYVHPQT